MVDANRIDAASHALGLILRGYRFQVEAGRLLRIVNPKAEYHRSVVWRLRADGTLPVGRACAIFSGTVAGAISQLVHWMHDRPRRPISRWEHWYGAESEIVKYLATTDYSTKTACVLCGELEPADWCLVRHQIGPCCSMTRCQRIEIPNVPREDLSNQEWCQRVAEGIPVDQLVRMLVQELAKVKKVPAWSAFRIVVPCGAGVAQALAARFGIREV